MSLASTLYMSDGGGKTSPTKAVVHKPKTIGGNYYMEQGNGNIISSDHVTPKITDTYPGSSGMGYVSIQPPAQSSWGTGYDDRYPNGVTPSKVPDMGSGGGGGGYGGAGNPAPVIAPYAPVNSGAGAAAGLGDMFTYPEMPTLRGGQSMADLLGVVYDRQEMERTMRDAAEAKYANLDAEYDRTQGSYYNNLNNMSNLLINSLSRGDRDAVRAGTASGTQAAQRLQALLGTAMLGAEGASQLATDRGLLVNDREAEIALAAQAALKQYNDMGVQLGTLGNSELGHKTVGYATEYGTKGALEGVIRQIMSAEAMQPMNLQNNIDVARLSQYSGGSGGSSYSAPAEDDSGISVAQQEQAATYYTLAMEASTPEERQFYMDKYAAIMGTAQYVAPTKKTKEPESWKEPYEYIQEAQKSPSTGNFGGISGMLRDLLK